MESSLVIHQASWLAPVAGPIIRDGAVAVSGGRIIAVGRLGQLKDQGLNGPVHRHDGYVLLPRLVNAHTHLELSHLSYLGQQTPPESFTQWVLALVAARSSSGASAEKIIEQARAVLRDQYDQGVIALADTGNLLLGEQVARDYPGHYLFFHEHLGFTPQAGQRQLEMVTACPPAGCCTAHAPYSCHASLITALKERAISQEKLFSIHVAETAEENQLIIHGTGLMRSFLEKMGVWYENFQPVGIDKHGALGYLHQLGVLDNRTICVHCVHLSLTEIALLVDSGAKVCLCPGSNQFLGVGRAPVAKLLQSSILPALGTDSLASNPELSIWREMALLHRLHPEVPAAKIVAMATRGGAEALGITDDYGTLEKGKVAEMAAVPVDPELVDADEILEFLVTREQAIYPVLI